eukprot:scaffold36544_cov83-Isochrysis_galbana.AAC.3
MASRRAAKAASASCSEVMARSTCIRRRAWWRDEPIEPMGGATSLADSKSAAPSSSSPSDSTTPAPARARAGRVPAGNIVQRLTGGDASVSHPLPRTSPAPPPASFPGPPAPLPASPGARFRNGLDLAPMCETSVGSGGGSLPAKSLWKCNSSWGAGGGGGSGSTSGCDALDRTIPRLISHTSPLSCSRSGGGTYTGGGGGGAMSGGSGARAAAATAEPRRGRRRMGSIERSGGSSILRPAPAPEPSRPGCGLHASHPIPPPNMPPPGPALFAPSALPSGSVSSSRRSEIQPPTPPSAPSPRAQVAATPPFCPSNVGDTAPRIETASSVARTGGPAPRMETASSVARRGDPAPKIETASSVARRGDPAPKIEMASSVATIGSPRAVCCECKRAISGCRARR